MTIIERLQREGIRRVGSPRRGFRYRRNGSGARISRFERERIQALKIPPAWRDVAIHASPRAAVQAVGRDAAGRWQYRYHESHVARRERAKRERLIRFVRALPALRRAVARDLARPGLPRERALAGAVRILATCFLRPGSQAYAAENGSYGIATLRPRHVTVRGDQVRFRFEGKSGRIQEREIRDRALARLLRDLLRHPGEVFKYRNGDGELVDVRRGHINAYIKEHMGEQFSAKDFRTWAGTLLCATALARVASDAPDRRSRRRAIVAVVREVAEHLGNTPAVCRDSYISPLVLQAFERGRVLREFFDGPGSLASGRTGHVERCERGLLELLSAFPAGGTVAMRRTGHGAAAARRAGSGRA